MHVSSTVRLFTESLTVIDYTAQFSCSKKCLRKDGNRCLAITELAAMILLHSSGFVTLFGQIISKAVASHKSHIDKVFYIEVDFANFQVM